ncbi:MAG: adenylate kinase [Candidatus Cyclobacteriaceae bacterium M2_1C_046]
MLNIVLFGPPGAGKGTQSANLIQKYNLNHISTGDLFRKHLSEGTELGKLAQQYMNDGYLVPDKVVIGMVEDHLNQHEDVNGYIFDGFPRTVAQAEALDRVLEKRNTPIKLMTALEVPEEELKKRLLERGKISGRADDQNEEKINNRIHVYINETMPVAAYYKKQDKFVAVNGVGNINDIFNKLCGEIERVA